MYGRTFTNQGLFVFDWKLYDGPYLKVQEPTDRIPDDLRFKILAVKDLPRIDMSFKKEVTIEENNI